MPTAVSIDAPALAANRRLPPYGREVVAQIESGCSPNVYVYVGRDAWRRADRRRTACGSGSAIALPDPNDAPQLHWPKLDAVVVDARDISRQEAIAIGAVLISAGCRYVAVIARGNEPLNFWRGATHE